MNLTLPEKEKLSKKTITFYIVITIICLFAIIVVVGVQVLGDDVVDNIFGINKLIKRTEQEEAELKANFETIFNNTGQVFSHALHCIQHSEFILGYQNPNSSISIEIHSDGHIFMHAQQPVHLFISNLLIIFFLYDVYKSLNTYFSFF